MRSIFFIVLFFFISILSFSQMKGNKYQRKSGGKSEELLSHLSPLAKNDTLKYMYYNSAFDTADLKYHHMIWQVEKILEITQAKDPTIKLWYTQKVLNSDSAVTFGLYYFFKDMNGNKVKYFFRINKKTEQIKVNLPFAGEQYMTVKELILLENKK